MYERRAYRFTYINNGFPILYLPIYNLVECLNLDRDFPISKKKYEIWEVYLHSTVNSHNRRL